MVIFRYLDGFWEQGRLPYPIAFSLFSNIFALAYFTSFIWMFGVVGGLIISLLCFFQIVHSAFLWIFLLPNLISTFKSLDNRIIPKVNALVYGGFSYLVVILMILTGVNVVVSPYKSMWRLIEKNIWIPILIFLCILVVGNIMRVIVMSKFLKNDPHKSPLEHFWEDFEKFTGNTCFRNRRK
jgi:hypothetical protein